MPKYRTVERNENRMTAKRIFIVGAVIACSFGVLFSRAVVFRLKDNAQLEKVALRQYRTAVKQSTKRGRILDSKGRELAIDVKVDSIFANPLKISEPVKVARQLADILDVDRGRLLDRLTSKRKFIWVKRRSDAKSAKKVNDLKIDGVYMMKESSRFYPGQTLASSVLGAVGFDSEPLGGVELFYNGTLSSQGGPGNFKRDARGHLYLSPADDEAVQPAEIELTIDRTLQYITERELANAVKKSGAKGATALVVDVRSGAVLAMANQPTFDPNEYSKYPLSHWRNRAIADPYEPGSTFKVIVVAAAIDRGFVQSEDIFDCENGKIKIGDHIVGDAHPHGELSVADIIKVSSNIGAYKVENRMSWDELYGAITSFGFGSKMMIDLPGESSGILSSPDRWSPLQHATIAFGQGVAATPLQITMAFAVIANGGTLYRPYIVKRVLGSDGEAIFENKPEIIGNPIKPATSKLMTKLLERVVGEGGTGTLASSVEYQVAGKTGTAQKAGKKSRGYVDGKYHSSFVGYAPTDNPRIAVYVGIDEPKGKFYYGGQVAAPVFREIVESSLQYMKIPGKRLTASADILRQLPPREAEGELALVEPLQEVRVETVVNTDNEKEPGKRFWKIPNLRGLTMRGVLDAAGDASIDWRFEGSGIAVGQSIDPGKTVSSNTICEVKFKPLMYFQENL
ncbi:MAG: transpeptidase family protein [Deltaproteobacteria bacterium]|jgi:cell division protein FtsI (penicillin-binding protein 3)|nr:transpeptidase family protein [Deltaproteobacteria bacterium]